MVTGNIVGGGSVRNDNTSGPKEANSNEVIIDGTATIIGNITGGESLKADGTANFNKITIGENVNISQVTQITGATSAQGTANQNELN
ncbi:hypothetical protein, partial [Campylobacter lanienae]|uniref:hypothetical protein n=1 Tax=Campylobacter lanienae TaxID=75658 RepID=UPI00112FB472